jgi:hypothetical protein
MMIPKSFHGAVYSSLLSRLCGARIKLIVHVHAIPHMLCRWVWAEELEKWIPDLRPGDVKIVRASTDIDVSAAKFVLVTYDLLQRSEALRTSIKAANPGMLVADESHYLKNKTAKRTSAVTEMAESCRYG